MFSNIVPPIMFPVHGFPGFYAPRVRNAETLKEPMLEVKRKAVLPRELPRLRASALTGGKQYGSVTDVLQIVYGQDFGTILKAYVENHLVELHRMGIMRDSLYIRFGGIGKTYIETNYDQLNKEFFLDIVADCLLEGEHYPQCVTLYIRYKMSFCVMNPRYFLWKIGGYRNDSNDELRDTSRTKADGNLLPRINAARFDEIVEFLLDSYDPEALAGPRPVDDSGATVPTPSCKLSISGYDLTSLRQFQANNPVTVTGVVRLGDRFENPEEALNAEDAHFYYNGQEIPVNLVPAEKLTADIIIAYDADGVLHVLIMPEIGTPEAVEDSFTQMEDKIGKDSAFLESVHLFSSTDEDVQQILNLADTVDFLRDRMEEFREAGDWSTAGQMEKEVGATLGEIDAQLQNLNDQDIANIGQEAAQLMAALASGNLDPTQVKTYAAELQRIYDPVKLAEIVMAEGS